MTQSVGVHLIAGFREFVENLVGLLRNAGLGRLQKHVHRGRLVAVKKGPQELVFPHRSPGKEEHAGLAVHNFDVRLAVPVLGMTVGSGRLEPERQLPLARFGGSHLEPYRRDLAVGSRITCSLPASCSVFLTGSFTYNWAVADWPAKPWDWIMPVTV